MTAETFNRRTKSMVLLFPSVTLHTIELIEKNLYSNSRTLFVLIKHTRKKNEESIGHSFIIYNEKPSTLKRTWKIKKILPRKLWKIVVNGISGKLFITAGSEHAIRGKIFVYLWINHWWESFSSWNGVWFVVNLLMEKLCCSLSFGIGFVWKVEEILKVVCAFRND